MRKRQSGFGLIELMIAMVLGLLLVLGMTKVFLSAWQTSLAQSASAQLQEDARYVLSKIAQEIRMAGMFGCLPLTHIIDAPAAFATPVSWQGTSSSGALHMVSADVGPQSGKPDWTVVTDCKHHAQVFAGAQAEWGPGETGFAVRRVTYRFEQGQLKSGLSNTVLLDNVAAFEVSFGVSGSASAHPVVRYESRPADATSIRSVRLALTLRDPAARVKDQTYHVLVAVRNRQG